MENGKYQIKVEFGCSECSRVKSHSYYYKRIPTFIKSLFYIILLSDSLSSEALHFSHIF